MRNWHETLRGEAERRRPHRRPSGSIHRLMGFIIGQIGVMVLSILVNTLALFSFIRSHMHPFVFLNLSWPE